MFQTNKNNSMMVGSSMCSAVVSFCTLEQTKGELPMTPIRFSLEDIHTAVPVDWKFYQGPMARVYQQQQNQ
jgi:hypothetical protein